MQAGKGPCGDVRGTFESTIKDLRRTPAQASVHTLGPDPRCGLHGTRCTKEMSYCPKHTEEGIPVNTETSQDSDRMNKRSWLLVIAAALGLALVSWVSKVPTETQIAGDADGWLAVRLTVRKITNSGTAWAGLGIACGWLVRRPLQAAAAGILGSVFSLLAHYAIGQFFGTFDATIWAEKSYWFIAALIFGAPLGLMGAMMRRMDIWGMVSRITIPVGAVLEPFVLGMFTIPPEFAGPVRYSGLACGIILVTVGLVGGLWVLARARRDARREHASLP